MIILVLTEQEHLDAINLKVNTMKLSLFLTLIFIASYIVKGQSQERVLKIEDNPSLGNYLSKNLESKVIGDSCYYGIYFIRFRLNKTGDLSFFDCTKGMPVVYRNASEQILNGLKDKWEKSFLKMVIKKKLTILQPILLSIDNQCKAKSYFPIDFDYIRASDSLVESIIARALPSSLAERITTLESSFATSLYYQNTYSSYFTNSIVLTPCTIRRISIEGVKKEL